MKALPETPVWYKENSKQSKKDNQTWAKDKKWQTHAQESYTNQYTHYVIKSLWTASQSS